MRVLIIPGHGGKDPGAVNDEGVQESDMNLSFALALGEILVERGYFPVFSRTSDVYISPSDQLALIRRVKPGCVIAIHCNASDNPDAHGMETIYRDEEDHVLASFVHQFLIAHTEMKDRGIKHDSETPHKRLAVLGDFDTPACLCEIGFISNGGDMAKMDEPEEVIDIANAIADGIEAWEMQR